MVQDVLTIVVVILVLVSALSLATLAFAVHVLRRRNRVVPTVPTLAPMLWLWSPRREARLHRRLRCVVATSHHAVNAAGPHRLEPLAELLADVEEHAIVIDQRLVVAAQAPMQVRRRLLAELRDEVRGAEAVAYRISTTATAWGEAGIEPPPLHRIHERLDVLEAAVADLDRVEAAERSLRS